VIARRRACIEQVRATLQVSERRACAALGQHRSKQRQTWSECLTQRFDNMREFKIGQYVFYRSRAEGRFVVMRLLAQPMGEPRYVIRSEDDASVEYNAEAKELRRASSLR
jgi:hypothetical protein